MTKKRRVDKLVSAKDLLPSKDPNPGDDAAAAPWENFLALVKGLGVAITTKEYSGGGYGKMGACPPFIEMYWQTGGVGGGSCWEDSEHHSLAGEPEPEFTAFDRILEAVSPAITFLQYKNLAAEVIEFSSRSENEYYGNSTTYGVKKVVLRTLFDALQKRGYLT